MTKTNAAMTETESQRFARLAHELDAAQRRDAPEIHAQHERLVRRHCDAYFRGEAWAQTPALPGVCGCWDCAQWRARSRLRSPEQPATLPHRDPLPPLDAATAERYRAWARDSRFPARVSLVERVIAQRGIS